jgi:hypothetical protein
MTSSSRLPIGDLDAALDQIISVDPIYLTTGEKQAAMIGLSRVRARVEAAVMRVLAVAEAPPSNPSSPTSKTRPNSADSPDEDSKPSPPNSTSQQP